MNKVLVVIPARAGSKGVTRKNIKILGKKPLIQYSIENARSIVNDEDICVSSDDDDIIKFAKSIGLKVPFKRPAILATDVTSSEEVILHTLNFYEKIGKRYDCILLLQPTSPFRLKRHLEEALALFNPNIDMVASVKETKSNPYYNCFEEDSNGFLFISKGDGTINRRQDAPKVFEFNGSIYVINPNALKEKSMNAFTKVVKYAMDEIYSIDIDNLLDWKIAELMVKEKIV